MSNQRANSMRIFTRRMEVQDISISSASSPAVVNILDLSGLTSGHLNSSKFEAKCTLFFDKTFGEAPITFCTFSRQFCNSPLGLLIGMADGNVVFYSKCPSRSLVEAPYSVFGSISSAPVHRIHVLNSPFLLVVHESRGDCFEFVTWKISNVDAPTSTNHFIIPDLKTYSIISSGEIGKVVYISKKGSVYIRSLEKDDNNTDNDDDSICSVDVSQNLVLHPVKNSDWILISGGSKLFVINHTTEKLITAFNLPDLNVSSLYSSSNEFSTESAVFEVFATITDSESFLKLTVDPVNNSIEKETIVLPRGSPSVMDCWVGSGFLLVTTNDGGVFVYDSLSLRCVNKFYNSSKYLKRCGLIRKIDSAAYKFLIVWGGNLVQTWDFDPVIAKRFKDAEAKTSISSSADRALLGNKSLRKYTRYSLNDGVSDWTEEVSEENQLQELRSKLNIDGLTEEEMIQYAQLLSTGNQPITEIQNLSDMDDSDLQLALQLSLVDM